MQTVFLCLNKVARCWNNEVHIYPKSNGYDIFGDDCCIYIKLASNGITGGFLVILDLWVDDIIVHKQQIIMLKGRGQLS